MSKTIPHQAMQEHMTQLRLSGMASVLEEELARAEREGAAPVEVIGRLLAAESAQRREKSLAYRLTQAKLPWRWTLDSFPFERQPGVNQGQIRSLAGLDFLHRKENILLIGPPGTGKTGLAIALLREACLNGHVGRFYNAQVLLDELGYLSLKPEQSNAFFRLMDQRYGRVSTIITTNLELTDWYALFANKPLVDALIDRLQHHCITLRIDGSSLRAPEPSAPATAKTSK